MEFKKPANRDVDRLNRLSQTGGGRPV